MNANRASVIWAVVGTASAVAAGVGGMLFASRAGLYGRAGAILLTVIAGTLVLGIVGGRRRILFSAVFGASLLCSYKLMFSDERHSVQEWAMAVFAMVGTPVLFAFVVSLLIKIGNAPIKIAPLRTPHQFSFEGFVCGGLFHLLLTVAVVDLLLLALEVKGAEDVESEILFYRAFLWVWTPASTLAFDPDEQRSLLPLFTACLTSILVGVLCGFRAQRTVAWLECRLPRITASLAWVSVRPRLRTILFTVVVLVEVGCIAGIFHARFVRWETRFSLRDSFKFRPFASQIRNAESFALYEGLPHQFSEASLLRSELASKETLRIERFDFYKKAVPITPTDLDALVHLSSSSSTYVTYSGPKLCGGFHPDFALTWSNGATRMSLLLCFGCGEMFFYDGSRNLLLNLRHESWEQFGEILHKYHPNRPKEES